MRTKALALLSISFSLFALGCDDEPEEAPIDTTPIIGVMELPISLRNAQAAPQNAILVEVSPSELRMDHRPIVALERGLVADGEIGGGAITKLKEAIGAGAPRRAAVLELHVNTPWETTALTLGALSQSNINEIAFKVRKPGGSSDTGYLVITDYRVEPATDDPVEVQAAAQRGWGDMVAAWEEAYEGCRRDHYVDCSGVPVKAAEGGKLELRFFARGSALKAEFRRIGAEETEPAAPAQPQMLEGIAPPPAPTEEELPPVENGAFTWRFEAAVDELSPISAAFRPLCGPRPCGVILTGDRDTMTMRLVSMLGAAFPDGSSPPSLVVHVPSR